MLKWLVILCLFTVVLPDALSARNIVKADSKIESNWKDVKSAVSSSTSEYSWVFFTVILPLMGFLSAIYGVAETVISGSPKLLVTWVGIGIVPYLIENIYGVMLPGLR